MSIKTDIEWCDSTVNPTTGCEGCELWNKATGARFCYAGPLHEGRLAKSFPTLYAPNFEEVRLAPGRMADAASWNNLADKPRSGKPWLDGMPRMIFVGDMGDIFSKAVPKEYLRDEVIQVATSPKGRRHIWMLLTKQANRAVDFGEWLVNDQGIAWPDNVWMGYSVTSARTESRAEIGSLHPAATKFLSIEPMLGPVKFEMALWQKYRLAIVGGESGPGARPMHPDWARSIRDQCVAAGVAYFFKQHGEWYPWQEPSDLDDFSDQTPVCLVKADGRVIRPYAFTDRPGQQMAKIGKKAAGRILDGRTWDEMPSVREVPA